MTSVMPTDYMRATEIATAKNGGKQHGRQDLF
jgi:hypothetical protein